MKKLFSIFMMVLMATTISTSQSKAQSNPWEKHGWQLAVQAYSFNRFTFEEALKFANDLGLKYIEAYPGQKIGAGSEGTTHFSMSQEDKSLIKELLAKYNLKLINYGIVSCKSEAEWEQLFAFAKEMGIETIGSEPEQTWLDFVESLVKKYDIQLAIHNHPNPTRYWDPQIVLKALDGRDQRMGASADNGHWMRSSIQPIDGYKLLEGRIMYLHFKDMTAFGDPKAHTVPFGTGVHDITASLKALKELGFKGVITIEYEHDWDNPAPKIAESIAYLRKVTAEL
jgi:sugar phosphate isomerase/epimerase